MPISAVQPADVYEALYSHLFYEALYSHLFHEALYSHRTITASAPRGGARLALSAGAKDARTATDLLKSPKKERTQMCPKLKTYFERTRDDHIH